MVGCLVIYRTSPNTMSLGLPGQVFHISGMIPVVIHPCFPRHFFPAKKVLHYIFSHQRSISRTIMKRSIILCFLTSLTCCAFPAFPQTDRDRVVKLSREDLGLYNSLKNEILIDLVPIRKEMKKLSFLFPDVSIAISR